jgi:hypothetical protein
MRSLTHLRIPATPHGGLLQQRSIQASEQGEEADWLKVSRPTAKDVLKAMAAEGPDSRVPASLRRPGGAHSRPTRACWQGPGL